RRSHPKRGPPLVSVAAIGKNLWRRKNEARSVQDVSWIARWKGLNVFVLGDVMLDKFIEGQVERISPEAPVPVLRYSSEKAMPGGAANVARNLVALGGKAILCSMLGEDEDGDLLVSLVEREGIAGRFVRSSKCPTTTKVRYVAAGQQIMRLDI